MAQLRATVPFYMFYVTLSFLLLHCYANRIRRQSLNEKIRRLPNTDVCGPILSFTFGIKVIGGTPADLGEYPWMALLGYKQGNRNDISWRCGGSLITDRFVITAAHCVIFSPLQEARGKLTVTTVRLGELDTDPNEPDGAEPTDYAVDRVIPHPQYDNSRKINDICLIRLKEKVKFTNLIKPICLPPAELYKNLYVGENATVAGWGKSRLRDNGNAYSDPDDTKLLKADLRIQDPDECKANYTRGSSRIVHDHRVLCASLPGKDSCQGDSGGPLMFKAKTTGSLPKGNNFLMGIVSYGNGCAKEGYAGVYTRVSAFMGWIIENIDFND